MRDSGVGAVCACPPEARRGGDKAAGPAPLRSEVAAAGRAGLAPAPGHKEAGKPQGPSRGHTRPGRPPRREACGPPATQQPHRRKTARELESDAVHDAARQARQHRPRPRRGGGQQGRPRPLSGAGCPGRSGAGAGNASPPHPRGGSTPSATAHAPTDPVPPPRAGGPRGKCAGAARPPRRPAPAHAPLCRHRERWGVAQGRCHQPRAFTALVGRARARPPPRFCRRRPARRRGGPRVTCRAGAVTRGCGCRRRRRWQRAVPSWR